MPLSEGCREANASVHDAEFLGDTAGPFAAGETLVIEADLAIFLRVFAGTFSGPFTQFTDDAAPFRIRHTFTTAGALAYWAPTGLVAADFEVSCSGTLPPDDDEDGVLNATDRCAGTVLPDRFPGLQRHRVAAGSDGVFRTGGGASTGVTVADTRGCSASQIISRLGLGQGHTRFGLAPGELRTWLTRL